MMRTSKDKFAGHYEDSQEEDVKETLMAEAYFCAILDTWYHP